MNARTLAQIQQIWYLVYNLTHRKVVPYVCHAMCGSSWLNKHKPWAFGTTSVTLAVLLVGIALFLIVPVWRRERRPQISPSFDVLALEQEIAIKEAKLSEIDAWYQASIEELFRP